jgi:two-component system, cell cycle response regulator DivK
LIKILLADDQPETRDIHAGYMRRHGFSVITVGDGVSALEQARTGCPDVIVLDHSMPGRSGVDVARALKSDPLTARIPVVLMTAHAYGAVGKRAREAGCAAFLAKPCGPRRVMEEVRRHLPLTDH